MSLAKQYYDDWLISINQQDCSFSRTEKNSNHGKYMNSFSITRIDNIFSIKPDTFFAEKICQHQLETFSGRYLLT